jgi:hypothetical protein
MQNHAKTGGILSIVAGAFGVLWLLLFVGIVIVMLLIPEGFNGSYYDSPMGPREMLTIMAVVYIIIGISHALVGALAIVGGVFALRKKHWAWALAGAIGAILAFFPCGIPAIIFVSLGKPEFQKAAPVPPALTATTIG